MNRNQKRAQRARHPKLKPSRRQREQVLTLTAEGLNRELVATEVGASIAKLRTDYARELDQGRKLAAYRKADEVKDEISLADYYFLDVLTDSFNSHWQDPIHGNLLFSGTDNKPARSIADAFAAFKRGGGRFNVTGRSRKLNKEKVAAFAKIVSQWKIETGKTEP